MLGGGGQREPRGAFIDSVLTGTDAFYADILQGLKAWSGTPPKLRPTTPDVLDTEPTTPASLSSTDYSSQDGPADQDPQPGRRRLKTKHSRWWPRRSGRITTR